MISRMLNATEIKTIRRYGRCRGPSAPQPHDLQVKAWDRFLRGTSTTPSGRTSAWSRSCARSSPIKSYDGSSRSSTSATSSAPRYTPDECREAQLSFGTPFKIGCPREGAAGERRSTSGRSP